MLKRETYLTGGAVLMLLGYFLPWYLHKSAFEAVSYLFGRGYMKDTTEVIQSVSLLLVGVAALLTLLLCFVKPSKAPAALVAAAAVLLVWLVSTGFGILKSPGPGFLLTVSGALTVLPVFFRRR